MQQEGGARNGLLVLVPEGRHCVHHQMQDDWGVRALLHRLQTIPFLNAIYECNS